MKEALEALMLTTQAPKTDAAGIFADIKTVCSKKIQVKWLWR